MKSWPTASLIIAIIIFVYEIPYLGETSLALVIMGVSAAIGINSIFLLTREED